MLAFTADGQSLWSPGAAIPLSIDTGDSLIIQDGFATEVGAELLGNGFGATACVDIELGLFAFASLGETGSFDSTFVMFVDVDLPGGLLIASSDEDPETLGLDTFRLDFSEFDPLFGSL